MVTLASVLTDTAINSGGESNFNNLVLRSAIKVSLFSVGICLQTNFMMVRTLSMISLGQSVKEDAKKVFLVFFFIPTNALKLSYTF